MSGLGMFVLILLICLVAALLTYQIVWIAEALT